MERGDLEALVAEGLPIRAIAARVGKSPTAIRYWLARYELRTARAASRNVVPAELRGRPFLDLRCAHHGLTRFILRPDGGYRCLLCRSETVARRRRELKQMLVEEAGGACASCGYDRSLAALHFHHVDPATKLFAIAGAGMARSLAAVRAEAEKCILLCANCHAEAENERFALTSLQHGPG